MEESNPRSPYFVIDYLFMFTKGIYTIPYFGRLNVSPVRMALNKDADEKVSTKAS